MARLLLILCLIFLFFNAAAQSVQIDSLQKALQNYPSSDTVRLGMMNDLVFYYSSTNPDRGVGLADTAILLALQLEDTGRLASAYNYKGLCYAAMGNDSVALVWLKKCLSIHQKSGNKKGQAAVLHNMGISYSNLSSYSEAMDCQQRAYDICKAEGNQYGMATILNSIGVVYLYLSDYAKALDCYFKALHFYEEKKDSLNMGVAYTNIGLVFHHASELKKALSYQQGALKIFEKTGDVYNEQNSLANIGNVYVDSGEIKKAIGFYQRALRINEKLENRTGIASDYMNMGTAYFNGDDFQNAYLHLQKGLLWYQQVGNNYGAGQTINYLVLIYLKADQQLLEHIGISASMRLQKAGELQRKGLRMGQISGNLEIQKDGWANMSTVYTRQKEFNKALQAYKKYILFRDSIFNDDKRAEIMRLSMQYAFDKKTEVARMQQEKEKTLAQAVIKRQKLIRNGALSGAGVLLIAGLISFVFYKRKRDAEEHKREIELKAAVADLEMKALRAQMNPHFVFNALNSISEFINKHETRAADYYLARFASLMRMILENSEQKEIPLADELKPLELYMELEAMRLNQKFTYRIEIDKDIEPENILVPPLLLQPYVENSIWHGLADKDGKGKILIKIRKKEDNINCVVEDNGVGLKPGKTKEKTHKSVGMKITSSRIELLNKIKNANGSVKLIDIAEGMRVEIQLPLIFNF